MTKGSDPPSRLKQLYTQHTNNHQKVGLWLRQTQETQRGRRGNVMSGQALLHGVSKGLWVKFYQLLERLN